MAQYANLSPAERKQLAEAWVKYGHENDLYVMIHVGSNDITLVNELALHAQSIGADAIAALPPFNPGPPNVDALLAYFRAALRGVTLPLYYYHLPGSTNVRVSMVELLEKSLTQLPLLIGVKYVDNNFWEFKRCLELGGGKFKDGMMWAPEPKLQAMPFGARGVVLAEPYYGILWRKIHDAYMAKDMDRALQAAQVLQDFQSLVSSGKDVMRGFGINLGPPRLPMLPISDQQYEQMYANLKRAGFFNQTDQQYHNASVV